MPSVGAGTSSSSASAARLGEALAWCLSMSVSGLGGFMLRRVGGRVSRGGNVSNSIQNNPPASSVVRENNSRLQRKALLCGPKFVRWAWQLPGPARCAVGTPPHNKRGPAAGRMAKRGADWLMCGGSFGSAWCWAHPPASPAPRPARREIVGPFVVWPLNAKEPRADQGSRVFCRRLRRCRRFLMGNKANHKGHGGTEDTESSQLRKAGSEEGRKWSEVVCPTPTLYLFLISSLPAFLRFPLRALRALRALCASVAFVIESQNLRPLRNLRQNIPLRVFAPPRSLRFRKLCSATTTRPLTAQPGRKICRAALDQGLGLADARGSSGA